MARKTDIIDLTKLKPSSRCVCLSEDYNGEKPFFSVCIPAYNAKDSIQRCVDSVLNQTFQDFEVIVVDDCSTDGQWELLNKLYSNEPKVKLVRNEKNIGCFGCRNIAILNSIGRYVLPFDADDTLFDNALDVLSRQFEHGVEVVQFGVKCESPEHESYFNIGSQTFDSMYDMLIYAYQNNKNHNMITKCFCGDIFRRFAKKLPLDVRINMMEDEVELIGLSCQASFGKVKAISDVLYCYSLEGQSNGFKTYSDKEYENDRNCLALVSKFISSLKTMKEKVDIVSNMVQSIIHRQTRDEQFFPQIFNETIPFEVMMEFIFNRFKGVLSDDIKTLSGVYLKYMVRPIQKHKIKTIGILYQTIAIGGVETFIVNICRLLMETGYKVVLLTSEINQKVSIPTGVMVERIEKQRWNDETAIRTRMKQVEGAILKHGIDLIFSQEYWQVVSLFDFISANHLGCYFMMCFHNNPCFLFQKRYGRFNFDYTFNCFRYFDKVITLSKEHEQLFREFGIDSIYIPNVVNPELIDIARTTRREFNGEIVWIGRFCEQKNPIDAIYAFNRTCKYTLNSDMRLKMVGFVENRGIYEQTKRLVEELGLEDKVDFCGDKTNDEVIQILKRARLLCYTSKFDGYPYLIAEAMACGIPIVAYEQEDLELFKCCKSIVQCSSMEQLLYNTLRTFNFSDEKLLEIGLDEKKCFLGIYGNNVIQKTYKNLFSNFEENNRISGTTFGKMLYRYVLQELNEK